jgi:hypothetical protein
VRPRFLQSSAQIETGGMLAHQVSQFAAEISDQLPHINVSVISKSYKSIHLLPYLSAIWRSGKGKDGPIPKEQIQMVRRRHGDKAQHQ